MGDKYERIKMEELLFEFHAPEKLIFGKGLASKAGREAKKLGASKVLIITDEGVQNAGLVEEIRKGVIGEGLLLVGVYTEVPQDSDIDVCSRIGKMAIRKGVDALISVGGGSVIDTAKFTNMLISCQGELHDYLSAKRMLKGPLKPHIAIPTTAGTGTEVGLAAIVKDPKSGKKYPYANRHLVPDVAILDPLMTVTLPSSLTVYTGLDAFAHAVEAYTSTLGTPLSDGFSRQAFRVIAKYLPQAFKNGSDIEARGQMLIAASMAGFALSQTKSLGACHAMAHALGGITSIPHGLACAVFLPAAMQYNMDYCAERYKKLASEIEPSILAEEGPKAASEAVRTITDFIRSFGIPQKLTDLGIKQEHLEKLTENTMGDVQIFGNPRPPKREEIRRLLSTLL